MEYIDFAHSEGQGRGLPIATRSTRGYALSISMIEHSSIYLTLYYNILHYITLYHIILHYITLYYTTLHYITLHDVIIL